MIFGYYCRFGLFHHILFTAYCLHNGQTDGKQEQREHERKVDWRSINTTNYITINTTINIVIVIIIISSPSVV